MRTTLTLDDDVAAKLKEMTHREKTSFKKAVNSVLRRGLAAQDVTRKRRRYRVATFRSALRPGIDPLRFNQLVDELEMGGKPLRAITTRAKQSGRRRSVRRRSARRAATGR